MYIVVDVVVVDGISCVMNVCALCIVMRVFGRFVVLLAVVSTVVPCITKLLFVVV